MPHKNTTAATAKTANMNDDDDAISNDSNSAYDYDGELVATVTKCVKNTTTFTTIDDEKMSQQITTTITTDSIQNDNVEEEDNNDEDFIAKMNEDAEIADDAPTEFDRDIDTEMDQEQKQEEEKAMTKDMMVIPGEQSTINRQNQHSSYDDNTYNSTTTSLDSNSFKEKSKLLILSIERLQSVSSIVKMIDIQMLLPP